MGEHETECAYVQVVCGKCREGVVRGEMAAHDCVAAMLGVFRGKEKELACLTTSVEDLTNDINK